MKGFTINTADRVRTLDTIVVDGRARMVEDITSAPTTARPARLAFAVAPLDTTRTFAEPDVIFIDAGDTVTFRHGDRVDDRRRT